MKAKQHDSLAEMLERSTRGLKELDAFLRRADRVSQVMAAAAPAAESAGAAPANNQGPSEAAEHEQHTAGKSAEESGFADPAQEAKYKLIIEGVDHLHRFVETISKLKEKSPVGAAKASPTVAKSAKQQNSQPEHEVKTSNSLTTIIEGLAALGPAFAPTVGKWVLERLSDLLIDTGIEELPGVKPAKAAVAEVVDAVLTRLGEVWEAGEPAAVEVLEKLAAAVAVIVDSGLALAALLAAMPFTLSGDNTPIPTPRENAAPGASPTPTPHPTAAPTPNPTANAAPDATPNPGRIPNQDAASAPGPAPTPTQKPAAAPTPGAAANAAPNPAPNAQPTSANDGASMTVHYSPTVNVTVEAEAAAGGSLSELVRAEVIKALHSRDGEVRDAVSYAIEQAFENALAGNGSRLSELFTEGMIRAFRSYNSELEYTVARMLERVIAREERCSFHR